MTEHTVTSFVDLAAALAAVRRSWRRLVGLRAAARALVAAAIIASSAAALGRGVLLSDTAALGLAGVAAAAMAAAIVLLLRPLRKSPDDRQVARFIEERFPQCGDAIATAVDLSERGETAQPFAPQVAASAIRALAAIDLGGVVERRQTRLAAWRAGGAVAAAALALLFAAPFVARVAEVGYVRLFPGSITLSVAPGDLRVAAGKSATIVAALHGRTGHLAHLAAQITLDASGETMTLPMQPTGNGYEFRVPRVDRSFHYMVSAGPAQSRAYAVTALHPARVERLELQYDFPSFIGLPPRLERDGGDVYAPAGTRVRVIVHADKPVREGTLAFSQERRAAALTRVDERTLAASLIVAAEGAYRVGLVDGDGLSSESVEYFVRVMDDRPPEVHIVRPGNDEGVTPLQEVPIEARADDDYGISRMDLVYSVGGGPEHVVPFTSLSGSDTARLGARMLAAEDLKVQPGDVIAYYARAWDVPRAKASSMTRSEIFFLEVRPFNEEYSLAQSQAAMQAATGTQLEGLISAQKEIISATWNLERRSGAGRSPTDIKGVADAQVELKGRAERAAGATQQRRRSGPAFAIGRGVDAQGPQPRPSNDGNDPVLKAADAMGRAAQELQGQKTGGAIPHEMAALNALLQAAAEIRQKQVAQQNQSSAGNPFGNRNQVDLSSLFDRELKRQQKSNYEDKPAVETPQQESGDSALDKIRDLARRQEELTRQQQQLAKSGLSEDEKKRQLEKLTREQEELRRLLENATRERAQDASTEGRSSKGPARGTQGAQADVQEALRGMREAAAHGKQADVAGAAQEGQQAAEALRRAEARMQAGTPDAQKRALGDLQLESQQIAQEQRRIAGEAERLGREGGGTTDARRRLAGDKDQLADRVDALQRSADGLPSAGDAARDLGSQQLGKRMREGAQQLRDGKARAPEEQRIADALDRVARKLGAADAGGAKGDEKNATAQLGGQLDELRDARDRVARLERQMRQIQQGAQTPAPQARGAGPDAQGRGAQGAQAAAGSSGAAGGDVAQLQRQLDDELQRTREMLDRLQRGDPSSGGRFATPEGHEWSHSAPGTEAFKQDYAAWQTLTAGIDRALERAESSASSKLAAVLTRDRLRAGGSERVPDAYRRQVSRYFEAIAVKPGGAR